MTNSKAVSSSSKSATPASTPRGIKANSRKPRSCAAAKPAPVRATQTRSKPPGKRDQLATLLIREEGATIVQMQEATGWLPHTVRAALTGLKKLGYTIDSDKVEGIRTYRAVAPK